MPAGNPSIGSGSMAIPDRGGKQRALRMIRQTGGGREETVNPTARWPERLAHIAVLLRAEGAAGGAAPGGHLPKGFPPAGAPPPKRRGIFPPDARVGRPRGAPVGPPRGARAGGEESPR